MDGAFRDRIPAAAVVVVNYFKAGRLVEGLQSLARQTVSAELAIAVVENSNDAGERAIIRAAAKCAPVKLIEPPENVGYTRGCNLGVEALPRSRYVLLCNPDIIWDQADAIERLIAIADQDPSIGVLAPVQFSDNGNPVEIARDFPTLWEQIRRRLRPERGREHRLRKSIAETVSTSLDVDWVQSSCTLISRALWDGIGGLDQRYFLFMSDVELGRRAWEEGFRVCLTSAAQVRADGKRASAGGFLALFTSKTQRRHLTDAIRYYLAHGLRKIDRRGRSGAPLQRVRV